MDEIIPKGIIYNLEDNNHNYSYAHATLQSLCFLYTTKELFSFMELHQMRDNNKYIYKFANEFLNLIEKIKQGITPESKDIIKYFKESYEKQKKSIYSENVLAEDPFHFLYFFLHFLHQETNIKNGNNIYSPPFEIMKDDNKIYNHFINYKEVAQDSMISNYFYNILRYTFTCSFCGVYIYYYFQSIYRMKLDKIRYFRDNAFPNKKGTNLEITELFQAYTGASEAKCKHCGNNKCPQYTKICSQYKIIIIYLERKNHFFKNDVNIVFDNLNLDKFITTTRRDKNLSTQYELKAVVSLANFGNNGKYIAYCKMPKGKLKNTWIRYVDSYYSIVQQNDITIYEPQLLIYERVELNNNNNNNIINMDKMHDDDNINNIFKEINNLSDNPHIINTQALNYNNNINRVFNKIKNNNQINNDNFGIGGNIINNQSYANSANMKNNNLRMSNPNVINGANSFNNLNYPYQPQFIPNMPYQNYSNNIYNKNLGNNNNIQQPINNIYNPFIQQPNQINNFGNPNMQINMNNNPSFDNMSLQGQNNNLFNLYNFGYDYPNNQINYNK